MKVNVQVIGMSKPASFTLQSIGKENIFWGKSGMPQDRFNALFDYCAGDWKTKKIAEIKCDSLSSDGTHINAIVTGISEI